MVATLLSIFTAVSKAMAAEKSFIMVKPDGVQRGLVGEIIKRFENRGFKLIAMKMLWPSEALLKEHYKDLCTKPFFDGLCKYMHSGPVVAMAWEGAEVVKMGRMLLGETNPKNSLPGTIRGDFCIDVGRNICHGSDSPDNGHRECELWFKPDEFVDWKSCQHEWVNE